MLTRPCPAQGILPMVPATKAGLQLSNTAILCFLPWVPEGLGWWSRSGTGLWAQTGLEQLALPALSSGGSACPVDASSQLCGFSTWPASLGAVGQRGAGPWEPTLTSSLDRWMTSHRIPPSFKGRDMVFTSSWGFLSIFGKHNLPHWSCEGGLLWGMHSVEQGSTWPNAAACWFCK